PAQVLAKLTDVAGPPTVVFEPAAQGRKAVDTLAAAAPAALAVLGRQLLLATGKQHQGRQNHQPAVPRAHGRRPAHGRQPGEPPKRSGDASGWLGGAAGGGVDNRDHGAPSALPCTSDSRAVFAAHNWPKSAPSKA